LTEAARYRLHYQEEIDSAALYRAIADLEKRPQIAGVYRRMAMVEEKHARTWAEKLRAAGGPALAPKPSARARILMRLAKWFGPQAVLPVMSAMERSAVGGYGAPDAAEVKMRSDEQSHARLLRAIRNPAGVEGDTLARVEGRHHAIGGNALRAAVLGVNDGLVSNLSLVMGVAGADLPSRAIVITGFAGLLAGAGSMAMGEWLSVQSSRELNERQIAIEAEEIASAPEEEAEELALIYQAKGLNETDARLVAGRLIEDQASALDTLAREELGVDPEELGGSAWEAALMSFLLFIAGAIVPVIAFVFFEGRTAIIASLALSAVGLFSIGAATTLMTGRGVLRSGLRQLAIGILAAGLTYGVGHMLGVAVAG
jgi:VIT1/CCC1 family predicted Fe2+/Mn2+ transporter